MTRTTPGRRAARTGEGATATVADALGAALADAGVRHTFGVVGVGNVRVVAALTKAGVRYVPARHEAGAATMADAYHRVSGEVGICTVTYGPGLTNTATGLADAVKNRSAVVVVCGDPPGGRQRSIDIDQQAFATSLGAATVRVTSPADAVAAVAVALRTTVAQGRPVVLFVPVDVQAMPAGPPQQAPPAPAPVVTAPGADVGALVALLGTARRPVLLAGLGAWRADARGPIATLAELCGGLLATTLPAKGIFGPTPWSLGVVGSLSSPTAAELIGEADMILAFGASMSEWTLHGNGRGVLDPSATVVQVDLRPEQISPRTDIGIVGDARAVATALCDGLLEAGTPTSGWRRRVADRVAGSNWNRQRYTDRGTADRIDPRTLSSALAELLPEHRTLVTDGGHFIGWPARYWPVADPSGFVFTGMALQSIGLGFAGAVGAALGRSDRVVVLAVGDGGALMGLSELDTLIRTADSALVVVYDDAAYGADVHLHGDSLEVSLGTIFTDTDFGGLARSLGAEAAVVRTVRDLDVVRAWRDRGCAGTLLLDCKIVRDVIGYHMADPGRAAPSPDRPATPTEEGDAHE
ncbi:thiamine pyrophosphate-binding protein [Umezawaea sp. Da 62-37]|uniref:thiamine pyrophosphate-binding protein n=1 Tax=Umezawaea sp. Da 62-37 TaxID=3075927 RepID=UPI0028F730A1|nr:thiamine pyrophosphate-binding protein [Umezawaea sp. Da 62-37]WNV84545.1 thiamine pyrophosphate-binding protein [Umezawaea sp. Da 62-37]